MARWLSEGPAVDSELDAAALTAVRQWRHTPTTVDGEPVDVLMTVTINVTGVPR